MSEPQTAPETARPVGEERTLGQLVADASKDLSDIVRAEVALAKAELRADIQAGAAGGAMFGVAGVFAFLALILLLIAAAYGLVAAGLPPWAAFLIVAAVLLILGGIVALVGRSRIQKVGPPQRTIRTTKETVEVLKQAKPHAR